MAALARRSSSALSFVSCLKKLSIENIVAFGDAEDILNDEVITSDGGTIIFTILVNKRLDFIGIYVLHLIGPDTTLDKDLN